MSKEIRVNLTIKDLKNLQKELKTTKRNIDKATQRAIERLGVEGVLFAQEQYDMYSYDSDLSTGLTRASIVALPWGNKGVRIIAPTPQARFMEFGTGIRGANSPHPEASKSGWRYDTNGHGEKGWLYPVPGAGGKVQFRRTQGLPARPFMLNTRLFLMTRKESILREEIKKVMK